MLASSRKKPWFRFTMIAMQFFTVLYICIIASDSDIFLIFFFLQARCTNNEMCLWWMRVDALRDIHVLRLIVRFLGLATHHVL